MSTTSTRVAQPAPQAAAADTAGNPAGDGAPDFPERPLESLRGPAGTDDRASCGARGRAPEDSDPNDHEGDEGCDEDGCADQGRPGNALGGGGKSVHIRLYRQESSRA